MRENLLRERPAMHNALVVILVILALSFTACLKVFVFKSTSLAK